MTISDEIRAAIYAAKDDLHLHLPDHELSTVRRIVGIGTPSVTAVTIARELGVGNSTVSLWFKNAVKRLKSLGVI